MQQGWVLPCTVPGQSSGKLQEEGTRTMISLEQQVRMMQLEPCGELWVPLFSGGLWVLWEECFKEIEEHARGVVCLELSAHTGPTAAGGVKLQ